MPVNKDRIYVALFVRSGKAKMRGQEDKCHWGIVVGPKFETLNSTSTVFHARERMEVVDGQAQSSWIYEEQSTAAGSTSMILARIMMGKVVDMDRLTTILRLVQVKGGKLGWNCISWVQDALQALEEDGQTLGTSNTDWSTIRFAAMRYVEQKKLQHRFDGQGDFDLSKVATWDLLQEKEIVP